VNGTSALAVVLADIVVVALTIASLAALAGAMWLVLLVVLSVSRKIKPARRPSSTPNTPGPSSR
jgi:hypothetical protein